MTWKFEWIEGVDISHFYTLFVVYIIDSNYIFNLEKNMGLEVFRFCDMDVSLEHFVNIRLTEEFILAKKICRRSSCLLFHSLLIFHM